MSDKTIERLLNEILELLKPKVVQQVEEWEDVTEMVGSDFNRLYINDVNWPECNQSYIYLDSERGRKYRLRKIDGLHNGPAFIIERRKS